MTNQEDAGYWLEDAGQCLANAQADLQMAMLVGAVQRAQLCIERSAKAVIACFARPLWSHNPSRQLRRLLSTQEKQLARRPGTEMMCRLESLATDADEAAPWHGLSSYGREVEDGPRIPAVRLCTEEVARQLVEKAERSLPTARDFVAGWFGKVVEREFRQGIVDERE